MSNVLGSLKDRVAIVTGAARGIGREYALALAGQGARVVVADIIDGNDTVGTIQAAGGQAYYQKTDVTSEADTAAMAAAAAQRWGGIDILVNNAALYGDMSKKPWDQLSLADWDRMLKVNVVGVWLVSKMVVPYLKQRGGGKIVNVASGVHFTAPPNMMHYNVSKSAIVGFTRSLARELGDNKINVNAVSPGLVYNEASKAQTSLEYAQAGAQARIIKRLQESRDLVGTVLYLCSDLSDFMTGQNILVDGGQSFQ